MENEKNIINKLKASGFDAFIVGGAVRDIMLGMEPNDIDIATNAMPEDIDRIFKKSKFAGKAFGVSLIDGIEVATFRGDIGSNGRKPDKVKLGVSMKEDAERRDLTINAMFLDNEYNLIDFFNGKEDLENEVIRFVGNAEERIKEDNLRILRAIRFASVLNFSFEEKTKEAIIENAYLIKTVSNERIIMELKKVIKDGAFSGFVKICDELGLLKILFPKVTTLKGVEQSPKWHPEGDVFVHTMRVLSNIVSNDFALNIAALLHDIGKATTTVKNEDGKISSSGHENVGANMFLDDTKNKNSCLSALSNKEVEEIHFLIKNHMKIKYFDEFRKSKKVKLITEKSFTKLCSLTIADSMTSVGLKNNLKMIQLAEELEEEVEDYIEPIITGRDLINIGFNPKIEGKIFGVILKSVYEKQIEEGILNKEKLLNLARRLKDEV